jgi:hypothetical protein
MTTFASLFDKPRRERARAARARVRGAPPAGASLHRLLRWPSRPRIHSSMTPATCPANPMRERETLR